MVGVGAAVRVERRPFYTRTWFLVTAGVAALAAGAAIGYHLGRVSVCDIPARGSATGC